MAEQEKGIAAIVWTDYVGIEQAAQYKKQLIDAFDTSSEIHLDISGVTDIDITGLQLILASRKESVKRHVPFIIVNQVSPVIDTFCTSCGINLTGLKGRTTAATNAPEKEPVNA